MVRLFSLFCLLPLLHSHMLAAEDPRIGQSLYRLSKEASAFWQKAPGFTARETVKQRAPLLKERKKKPRSRKDAEDQPRPQQIREIGSFYALGAFHEAPEALREFRLTFSIDGKPTAPEPATRMQFESDLRGGDSLKRKLLQQFEQECLAGSATDFGQLLLLFGRANQNKYTFKIAGQGYVGADGTWLLAFEQTTGRQALRIQEGGRKTNEKLQGEVWARKSDYLPLRITLKSSHKLGSKVLRDEAQVDYATVSGTLLPAAVTYRRYVNQDLALESVYRYTDWQPVSR